MKEDAGEDGAKGSHSPGEAHAADLDHAVEGGTVGETEKAADDLPVSSVPASSAKEIPAPSAVIPPPALPTQLGPHGIRFDFNDGCRLVLPESDPPWQVCISDIETGNVLYRTTIQQGRVQSSKRYFVRGRLEARRAGELVFAHDYDATDREILINLPVGTLGDTIGWFPYAVRFQQVHRCRLTCAVAKSLIPLFRDAYPGINVSEVGEVDPGRFYAIYNLGLFFDDKAHVRAPCDFRMVGLHRIAGYILGVDPTEEPPRLSIPNADARPIPERYVCIATQATTQAKYWNNPFGWREIIRDLKAKGLRVICLDGKPAHGEGLVWNHIPNGAEDMTGLPLQECARFLRHCDLFVGLSSGLSWLAWAAGARVVMISGFSHPTTEFVTPGRVINYHACNSCWNDPALRFDHKDFLWCPRHKDTKRQFECTRLITAEQVKRVIAALPVFHGESHNA